MKKAWSIWLLVLCALVIAAAVVDCSGDDDDDDDDDNDSGDDDSGDDDSSDEGVCFWQCEWFDQVPFDGAFCLSGIDSDEECQDTAENSCLGTYEGTLGEIVYDSSCSSCEEQSCWPEWADFS